MNKTIDVDNDVDADGIFDLLIENTVTPMDDARGSIGLPKAAEGEGE